MEFKKVAGQVKDAGEDLKKKAQAKIKEAREALDKDHDHIPDALEGLGDKAKTLAAQAQGKAKDLAGKAGVELGKVKVGAEKIVDSARARVGMSSKDSKKG
jgi:hypothetical protein